MACKQKKIDGLQIGNDNNKQIKELKDCGLRLGLSVLFHPIDYAKILKQLGFIPPRFGRYSVLRTHPASPNILQYVNYIRNTDGLFGCYRGITPKLIGSVVIMTVNGPILKYLGVDPPEDCESDTKDENQLYSQYTQNLKYDIIWTTSSILILQPFDVICIRMMAEFIGRDQIYSTIFGSISEIYSTEGVSGFFSGVVPKLICHTACAVLRNSLVYFIHKYLVKDKAGRTYSSVFTQFACSILLYPLQIVATCMAVNGSRLYAGQPPFTPLYNNWSECLTDLIKRGELKTRDSLIWR